MMVTIIKFSEIALSFPEVIELPHFEKISFRIKNKIFATLCETTNIGVVKLSLEDQSAFCSFGENIMTPVKGKWGLKGWTNIDILKADETMILDALTSSYITVAQSRLTKN
ncbi:MAG: hypothetical protein WBP08_04740 [Saprospiraceae bacterium]